MTHFQLLQALAPLEHLISLNLYRTSVSQTSLLAILCNNRDLENLNLSACPNIQGDEVLHLIEYKFQHQPHFHFLDHHTFTFQSKSQKPTQVCLVLSCCQLQLTCLDLWRCSSLTARGVAALAACSQLKVAKANPESLSKLKTNQNRISTLDGAWECKLLLELSSP